MEKASKKNTIPGRLSTIGYAALSVWIWFAMILLIVLWFPFLLLVRAMDHDEVHYRTGRWFRRLGAALTRINPLCKLKITGEQIRNPRLPFLVVCNHQSAADIPIVSTLPWEMKWVGKEELFRIPVVGWMMQIAGDICLDRKSRSSGARAMVKMRWYLDRHCSVIVFPEGTRSKDNRLLPFRTGAFAMAIKAGVPVLPLVVNGSNACLPKHSWIFHGRHNVTLTVLPPVHTKGLTRHDVDSLTEKVRQAMYDCLKEQGVEQEKADIHGAVHPIPVSVSGDGIEKPAEAQ